jgi:4-aminobutyrate aminotransferase-like enzyme
MPTPLDPAHVSARRAARTGGNLSISYRPEPLTIVRGWRQHLYDHEGRSYLDAYNNVAHVGHSHPRVVEAVARQLSLLNTNTRYLQPQLTEYADELIALFPDPLSVCWFTASGSEANELALRLTRAHTGRRDLLVMDAAYHGHTTTLIDISPYKHDGPGGKGAPAWVHTTVIPDAYRRGIPAAASGPMFAAEVGEVVDRLVATGTPPSAYIAESCPSVAGQILLPDGFLAEVYRRVRAVGGLCIADEVQTGFGRLGTHRWAFEAHGVVPDVVVLGKPIANGYPMGAVVTTREIAASFDDGMEFFSTFGGSTAACAAARATLQVVRDEGLQEHADAVGNGVLLPGLQGLVARHEVIGDVRGSGLFVGIELVADRAARTPAPDAAAWVVQRMRHLGVLAGTDGPAHNVIKLRGPLPLSAADAQCIVDVLDIALTELPPPLRSS